MNPPADHLTAEFCDDCGHLATRHYRKPACDLCGCRQDPLCWCLVLASGHGEDA